MITMTLDEWHAALKAQGVEKEDLAFKCPMCGTIQSARDLIYVGAGPDFDTVQKYLAFSCIGRWTGAGSPRGIKDGKPCNWTLGGLFQTHKLEVLVDDGGKRQPYFEPATPEEAQTHAQNRGRQS
jgi:hypothetical protein